MGAAAHAVPGSIVRITRAGLPTATTFAGSSRLTTAPAPTTVFSPIVTPAETIAPLPSHPLSPIVIDFAASQFAGAAPDQPGASASSAARWTQSARHHR